MRRTALFWALAIVTGAACPAAAFAQGVDYNETFNDANRAAVDQARTTNLNSALGVHGERAPWPNIAEGDLERRVFTLAELKAMMTSDRARAQQMLEGRVITVRGQAGRPNRWGTWLYVTDPGVKFSAKGEWASAIAQPGEGTPLSLRGRVSKLQASTIYIDEPQILR